MIKAIVLDIDGVILGTQKGINFPTPHTDVSLAIKDLIAKGKTIILCSAKPMTGSRQLILELGLNSYHVSSNGMEIFNPFNDNYKAYEINKKIAHKIAEKSLVNGFYTELFTPTGQYMQKNQYNHLTDIISEVRNLKAHSVTDLQEIIASNQICRMSLVIDVETEDNVKNLLNEFTPFIDIHWSTTPQLPDKWFVVISKKGISKGSAVKEVAQLHDISFDQILGVGDGINDWSFIEMCGYKAAMGNANQELKNKVMESGKKGFIGGDINENGLLDILSYFNKTED